MANPLDPTPKPAEGAVPPLSDSAASRVAERIRNEKELEASMRAFEKTAQEMSKFKKALGDRYTPKNGIIDLDTLSKEDRNLYLLMDRKIRTARELVEIDIIHKLPEIREEYARSAIDAIDRDIAAKLLNKDIRVMRISAMASQAQAQGVLDKGFPQNLGANTSTVLTTGPKPTN